MRLIVIAAAVFNADATSCETRNRKLIRSVQFSPLLFVDFWKIASSIKVATIAVPAISNGDPIFSETEIFSDRTRSGRSFNRLYTARIHGARALQLSRYIIFICRAVVARYSNHFLRHFAFPFRSLSLSLAPFPLSRS